MPAIASVSCSLKNQHCINQMSMSWCKKSCRTICGHLVFNENNTIVSYILEIVFVLFCGPIRKDGMKFVRTHSILDQKNCTNLLFFIRTLHNPIDFQFTVESSDMRNGSVKRKLQRSSMIEKLKIFSTITITPETIATVRKYLGDTQINQLEILSHASMHKESL